MVDAGTDSGGDGPVPKPSKSKSSATDCTVGATGATVADMRSCCGKASEVAVAEGYEVLSSPADEANG